MARRHFFEVSLPLLAILFARLKGEVGKLEVGLGFGWVFVGITMQGSLNGTHLGGMKHYKCMVNLKDFPKKMVHWLGWEYNDKCYMC